MIADKFLVRMLVGFVAAVVLQFCILDFNVNNFTFKDYMAIGFVALMLGSVVIVIADTLNKFFGVPVNSKVK
jgi:uncharacterized membrane protein YeaQ/YmgE (transglycosylase-associated protein family)|tara:strand:+ start:490 stop:705 length:216 start_codon:yes stop_codon:yes gene_type:complete